MKPTPLSLGTLLMSIIYHIRHGNTFSPLCNRFPTHRLLLPLQKAIPGTPWASTKPSLPYCHLAVASTNEEDISNTSNLNSNALRHIFVRYCGSDGMFMTWDMLQRVPFIRDMLEGEELSLSELMDIWKSIITDSESTSARQGDIVSDNTNDISLAHEEEKIDVLGFLQICRDIDDLFEDEDDNMDENESTDEVADSNDSTSELKEIFDTLVQSGQSERSTTGISNSSQKSLSFEQLRKWEEVKSLIEEEGMLSENEFIELWEKVMKDNTKSDMMNFDSFVLFNDALDELFLYEDEVDLTVDDEEGKVDSVDDISLLASSDKIELNNSSSFEFQPIIKEINLSPTVLFSRLANENYLVGLKELQRWGELKEMMSAGDLSREEFQELWDSVEKAPGTRDTVDEKGFKMLYHKIDDLFEDEVNDAPEKNYNDAVMKQAQAKELKEQLLTLLEDIAKISAEEGRQQCGLDCTEIEQERVLEVVGELEREPYNRVACLSEGMGATFIEKEELVGTWNLLYSSSSTMKYNEGLSGLAGGLTKFGGLQQILTATKYLSDVEYIEQVVGKIGGQSFEVKITGDWDLRTETSLFTGKPSNVLTVTPDQVKYGLRSDKADHWKSLGPMNLLLLSYLDEDIRIMRGNTSTDTLFIFQRIMQ